MPRRTLNPAPRFIDWFKIATDMLLLFTRNLALATGLLLSVSVAAQPQVYVVNYPLQYFAERIAGAHAGIVFPAPANVDPAFWQPSVENVLAYQRADVIFLNGAGYAKWLARVTLPRAKLIDTSVQLREQLISVTDDVSHQHGPAGQHSHAGTAFTTWLDLHFAGEQARAIYEELSRRWPTHSGTFAANFEQLQSELAALDNTFSQIGRQQRLPPLMASHPVYQYFARRYALDLESVMWEPGVVPDDAQWQRLRVRLTRRPVRFMLWEASPQQATLDRLRALGITSVVVDPCANRPLSGDFLTVMHNNLTALRSIAAPTMR